MARTNASRIYRLVARGCAAAGLSLVMSMACPGVGRASTPTQPRVPTRTPTKPRQTQTQPPPEYHFEPDVPCPYCGITPEYPQGRYGLHWHNHWRRVGIPEYVATPLLFGAALGVQYLAPKQTHPYWTGPILFDKAARKGLLLGTQSARSTASKVSDVLVYASVAYPYVIDDALVTWGLRQSPEVAWQMTVINTQAYAMTLALMAVTKRVTGRERPFGEQCRTNPDGLPCGQSTQYQSFYSGHAAMSATGAALVCTHHTQLEIYSDSTADASACLGAIGVGVATSILRMSSDNHWATDVVVGDLMGVASGYLVPTLLYYKRFRFVPSPVDGSSSLARVAVLPMVLPDSVELAAVGQF